MLMGFPCGSAGKEFICNVGNLNLIPGLGRSPREGTSYPLQYPDLYSPWGCRQSDMTEQLSLSLYHYYKDVIKYIKWRARFKVKKCHWKGYIPFFFFSWLYWDIIDPHYYVSIRYTKWWFYSLHITNDYHNKVS